MENAAMFKMGLLGKKVGMTQIFTDDGLRVPVTVVATGPCVVLAKRTLDTNGYAAIQLGFDDQKMSRMSRPDMGRFEKANTDPKRFVHEIRLSPEAVDKFEVGQEIKVEEVFADGDIIDVTGTSKGKGFQGVVKKYHFRGGKRSHGVHECYRHGGSLGCRLTPGRVVKGKKMPGQMGNHKVTTQNIKVVSVRPDDNLLLVRGGIPGAKNGYVVMMYATKKPLPDHASA
jgi:large subunit ribosomal protein L3